MRNYQLLLVATLMISCSGEPSPQETVKPEVDEVVDIRIYADGKVRFNGDLITESALPSYIRNLNISPSTRARIIFSEETYTGVVHKIQRLFHQHNITDIRATVLSSEDFRDYNKNKVHIDVLSSGEVMFRGRRLHPADLKVSLKNKELSPYTAFVITVSKRANMGTVLDIQKTLTEHGFQNIIHAD